MTTTKLAKGKGRPPKINRDEALKSATALFLENGYDATSIALLCESLNVKPPSLYSNFGDKQNLFCEVLSNYHKPYKALLTMLFAEPKSTLETITALLNINQEAHLQGNNLGCLIANSSIQVNKGDGLISDRVKTLHDLNEKMIFDRIELGKKRGDVHSQANSAAISRYVNGLIQGSAVLARGQGSNEAVKDLITIGIASLSNLLTPAP